MYWSPWQGWLRPPSSKDPPEKPKVLQPSAKCPFRTHRGHVGVLPRAGQSSEAVAVPCPHQALFPQARLAASPVAPAPSSFPCSFPGDVIAPSGPRLVPPAALKEDARSGCGAGMLLCCLPPSRPGWQAGPHGPSPRQEGTPEEQPLAEELQGLAVAHGAVGKAGNSRGFWSLGTLCPQAGAGPSSISNGVFLAGGKPRAWGACGQHCPACSPSCCPGRAGAAPEPLHGPSRYQ